MWYVLLFLSSTFTAVPSSLVCVSREYKIPIFITLSQAVVWAESKMQRAPNFSKDAVYFVGTCVAYVK